MIVPDVLLTDTGSIFSVVKMCYWKLEPGALF